MSAHSLSSSSSEQDDDEEFVPVTAVKKQSGLSLKGRAIGLLSRREYSRDELARKLKPHADTAEQIDALLNALVAEGWQSDERFIQSVLHRKAPLHGALRITQELKLKGMNDTQLADVRMLLKDTELGRAQSVWQKKFGLSGPASDPKDYARQARFLAGRGFSHEVIRRVLKGLPEEEGY
jgi:regulatory protein